MDEILQLLKESSPVLILLVVVAYFAKVFFEKRLEGLAGRVEEIARTSLDVKKDLRGEERGELVALRVAVEKWQYFLESAIGDFTMLDPLKAQVGDIFDKDKQLFLDVRIGIVKVGTYLRNPELEQKLMNAILKIRYLYYPLINEAMPKLIDLQAQLMPIQNKLNAFQQSGMKDMTYAPTERDRDESSRLQAAMTEETRSFAEKLVAQYRPIAEQMVSLKEAINYYIYRPIRETAIDKE